MSESSIVATILFTDIEGSTRLWEREPERMRPALARHDALLRAAVASHRGTIIKMTGDGAHASFRDPLDAVGATLELQQSLAAPEATQGLALQVRCGVHTGRVEPRDNDVFGTAVNRAARLMSAAHGGQVLLSQAASENVRDRLSAGLELRDLGLVRLRDLANPEHVFQLVHPKLRQDFPALRSLESTPNNLPQQVASFVGRERELADVRKLLGTTRLLTLVGMGGLGKTRLSLQVAADVMDDYPDGVWLVEFAPLSDAQRVAQAVASVLGVKEEPGHRVEEALAKFVKDRRLLLIFDNSEHLLAACADLAKLLLQSGPQVKVLASSREPLHVAGETTYPLQPMAVPGAGEPMEPAAMMQVEAVRLFADRAGSAQPAFAVTDQNTNAVATICRRVDGIPLALELAAARVRSLSVEKIAERLIDRFRLLSGGDRTALPRQQTLRALIDWSHDLLTEDERVLLRRLAAFAAGWTLEAAEAVCAGGGIARSDVVDLLTRLVEKSLVVLEAHGGRYRMLDTVREYAQQRLGESGEGDAVRDRHLDHYLAFAEEARPRLNGPDQAAWLGRLDLERENLLSAHAWCGRSGRGVELGLRLVSALRRYWIFRGVLGLGYGVTIDALARSGAQQHEAACCDALFDAGQLGYFMGRYTEARDYLERSLAIAKKLGDLRRVAATLQPLGSTCLGQGDRAIARCHLEEALAFARELGNPRELAAALNQVAQLCRLDGSLDSAEPLFVDMLSLARQLGDGELLAIGLLNLAMVSIGRGLRDNVPGMLLEVLTIADCVGSRPVGQSAVEVCAGLAASCEDWCRAARLFGAAESLTGQTGIHRDPADEAFLAPLVERARANLGPEAFEAEARAGRSLSYGDAIADVRAWLSTPALPRGIRAPPKGPPSCSQRSDPT